MKGCWHAKLAPYVKNGRVDGATKDVTNNDGVWHCPDAGSQGEFVYFKDANNQDTNRYAFSYGMSGIANYTRYILPAPEPAYYRYPRLTEMYSPANTIYIGDGGGFNGRLAPPTTFDCYNKRYRLRTTTYPSGTFREVCWEIPDRHNGGANYVFFDGHTKFLQADVAYPTPARKGDAWTAADTRRAREATLKFWAYNEREVAYLQQLLAQ